MKYLLATLILFSTLLSATELQPWFGIDKLIEIRPSYTYRYYSQVDEGGEAVPYTSNDNFFNVSFAASPAPEYSLEVEFLAAVDHQRNFGMDTYKLTGRYLLMDDVTGLDPVSLAVGLSVDCATRRAVQDISSFHHGMAEAELHVAVGKEISCGANWVSHTWGLFGVGFGDFGSEWLHARGEYDYQFNNGVQAGVFSTLLFGLGARKLDVTDFHSYGHIQHRYLSLGAFVRYCDFTLQYESYVYARNFPRVVGVKLTYYIPFNL